MTETHKTVKPRQRASAATTPEAAKPAPTLSPEHWEELKVAHEHLEHPSLAVRLSNVVGTPIEIALHLLPRTWYQYLHSAAEATIAKVLDTAIATMHIGVQPIAHDYFYQGLVIGTGAIGGFWGPWALLAELPITTTIILRSIADIARSEGESLESVNTQMACAQVFALGGRSEEDDAADTGYYGVRLALALPFAQAQQHIVEKGLADNGGPVIASLLSGVASRFGLPLSQKVAVQLVPVIGAVTGAVINTIFINHFQDVARSHFTVRRLERQYGAEVVQAAYESLSR